MTVCSGGSQEIDGRKLTVRAVMKALAGRWRGCWRRRGGGDCGGEGGSEGGGIELGSAGRRVVAGWRAATSGGDVGRPRVRWWRWRGRSCRRQRRRPRGRGGGREVGGEGAAGGGGSEGGSSEGTQPWWEAAARAVLSTFNLRSSMPVD